MNETKKRGPMLPAGAAFKKSISKYFGVIAIILLCAVFTTMEPQFLGTANLRGLLSDSAPLMIMAAGMTLILILGSIDLSVGAVCSVSNVLVVKMMIDIYESTNNMALSVVSAYGIALAFGLVSGLLLGVVHVYLKVPSFIASLGFMSIWQSIALLLTPSPVSIKKALWGSVAWVKVSFGVVGFPLILALVLIVVFYILQSRTPFGKYLMAIGGNERASRLIGIPVNRTKVMAFVLMGMCSSLGGIFLAAKLRSSAPTVGDSFTLLVIASSVLGGTALTGGKGSVLRTVLGVFMASIIRNGMNMIGVDVFWQNIVFGLVVLGAVALTVDRSGRNIAVK